MCSPSAPSPKKRAARARGSCVTATSSVGLPLADNYAGPYLVLKKGPKVFKLQLGGRTTVVSRDQLKPHVG